MKKEIEKNNYIKEWHKKIWTWRNIIMKWMAALSGVLLLWCTSWWVSNQQKINKNDAAVIWLNVELNEKNQQIDTTTNLVKACRYKNSEILEKVSKWEDVPTEEIQKFLKEYYESVFNQLFEMLWEKKTNIILREYSGLSGNKEVAISRFLQERGVIDALERGDTTFFQNMVEWIVFEDIQDAKRAAEQGKSMWELWLLKSLGYR